MDMETSHRASTQMYRVNKPKDEMSKELYILASRSRTACQVLWSNLKHPKVTAGTTQRLAQV